MVSSFLKKSLASVTVFLVIFILGVMYATVGEAKDFSGSLKLTILYMNDAHGHYSSEKQANGQTVGGFAKAMTLIEKIRKSNEREGRDTLILMAGDLLTGTAYSAVFKGELGVRLMNMMGFSAMVVGNHEFDFGLPNLLKRLKPAMKFPLLSANTLDKDGKQVFRPYMIKRFRGQKAKILILGLTTEKTPELTHPKNVKGLIFEDPVKVAQKIIQEQGQDKFVIALTHLGLEKDKKLGILCPGIDVIIGGHSHTSVFDPIKLNGTLVCQAGAYSNYLGRLDMNVVNGQIEKYEGQLLRLDENVPDDPRITSVVEKYKAKMSPFFNEVIGSSDVSLDASLSAVRSSSSNRLATLVAYVMAEAVGAEAGIINGGGIRDGIKIGSITNSSIYSVLPFQNLVMKVMMKGSDLESVLRRSLDLPERSGGKLQVYGIKYEVHNNSLSVKEVGSKKFNPNDYYSLAISDFLLAGGDGYQQFASKAKSVYPYGLSVNQIFCDFIKKNKVISESLLESIK